jgi:hypothetical protein
MVKAALLGMKNKIILLWFNKISKIFFTEVYFERKNR